MGDVLDRSGRTGPDDPPTSDVVATLDGLCARLRDLRVWAGSRSYIRMVHDIAAISRSTRRMLSRYSEMHNGFDGTGDECWFMGGKAAVDRGYNVLAFEGPGQGEVLHEQNLVFRPDWEHVVSPVLDYASTRPDVDTDRVALLGISMGGLLAPRAAAFEPRIKALIAFDGVYDMFDFALSLVPLPRDEAIERLKAQHDNELDALLADVIATNPLARWSTDHGRWAFGTPTARTFLAALRDYHLRDGLAERIACPTLVLKSEVDFAFAGQPEQLHRHLNCPKAFVPFTSEEGAGAHCQVGAMTLACARIYDWLDDALTA